MKDYYISILRSLEKLKKLYPTYNMGRHLSTILDEHGDVWGITDKELYKSVEVYSKQMALDIPHEDKEIEQIIKDGMKLDRFSLLQEGEDYYE